MKRVLKYMNILFETWESVGQMHIELEKEGKARIA